MPRFAYTSLTRIADLAERGFDIKPVARSDWATGDYVAGRVTGQPTPLYRLELADGRMVDVLEGECAIGAFGERAATLECTGSWRNIGADDSFQALTSAGLFGKASTVAPYLPRLMSLDYLGHVMRDGRKLSMGDFVEDAGEPGTPPPTVLLVGTSMSAGKTTAGRRIVHELSLAGKRVVGAKFTGAGRYRDVLSFQDAGAAAIFDFVDAGLPSTIAPRAEIDSAMRNLLGHIATVSADVLVAEAGASPQEPYNGAAAIDALRDSIRLKVLCASDPYAVVGVQTAFNFEPDLVTGPAASTDAAVNLVKRLTGCRALNLLDPSSIEPLREILHAHFD